MPQQTAAITVVIPSFNQGRFIEAALESIFAQPIPLEVYVLDGGSTDETVSVLERWSNQLAGWRSEKDAGQSWAINRGVALGHAPFVAWLNADDVYSDEGLVPLLQALKDDAHAPMAYGRCHFIEENGAPAGRYPTMAFSPRLFANFCFICQPGTLIRRSAWERVGGADESMDMCMDYDLWWRLYKLGHDPVYVDAWIASSRNHGETKTATRRSDHYREARQVVKRHWGRVPMKWYVAWPYKVWWAQRRNTLRLAGKKAATQGSATLPHS